MLTITKTISYTEASGSNSGDNLQEGYGILQEDLS